MLQPTQYNDNGYYDGSRAFTWLADLCGLSVDLVNFLICQITALFLASFFRSILHPSKVSSAVRHTFALSQGLAFGYFCFGRQAIHIAGLPAACFIVIRTQSPAVVQRTVMLVAMIYLLCIHLIRQIYDYGSYSLDITGPLMIITQKVTSLAFSIHDGFVRESQELTKAQQYHAVHKPPSALEYFSYVLHFQSLMAGPLVFYKDYIDFIEGYNLLRASNSNANLDNGRVNQVVLEPSPIKPVVKKVLGSIVCAYIFMKFVKMYPVKTLKEEDFLDNTSIFYQFWYIVMATTCMRFKYYHAWLLADAVCNNSGLGFSGYDEDGNAKWDLISNINVLSFEFSSNMRDAINNWNIGTNRWLRTVVYERVPKKYGTALTFTLSAVWHGFYPGYYLTFAAGALMVTSARIARRVFRHRFQSTQFSRMFYDIVTILITRLVMGYSTFPFVLLEFMGSFRVYLRFYFCFHVIALATIFILPRLLRGERREVTAKPSASFSNAAATVNGKVTSTKDNNDNSPVSAQTIVTKTFSTTKIPQNNIDDVAHALYVMHDRCEMDELSSKFKEKIDAETKNIEEFIDKTVTDTVSGIVGFKRDLMRDRSFPKQPQQEETPSSLRKRTNAASMMGADDVAAGGTDVTARSEEGGSGAFLKKEIEAVVQQANTMLPAVLSNGHAK